MKFDLERIEKRKETSVTLGCQHAKVRPIITTHKCQASMQCMWLFTVVLKFDISYTNKSKKKNGLSNNESIESSQPMTISFYDNPVWFVGVYDIIVSRL